MLQRNKSQIYLCKRDFTTPKVKVYADPVTVMLNIQDASDEYLQAVIGSIDTSYKIAKCDATTGALFTKGDVIYVDNAPSNDDDGQYLDAEYMVSSIKTVNATTQITFKGLI